ncbi:MAG: hypothetical protein ACQESP_00195 [Candidatus Muiribacteriota bacterium]
MKKITICLFILCFSFVILTCPVYDLVNTSPEEVRQKFDKMIDEIDIHFEELLENFGAHSSREFRALLTKWMDLYYHYEAWIEVTEEEDDIAVPAEVDKNWLRKISSISDFIGQGVTQFTNKNFSDAKKQLQYAQVEFETIFGDTFYNVETHLMKEFSTLLNDNDLEGVAEYYSSREDDIEFYIKSLKNNADDYSLQEYYSLVSSFFNKLSSIVDNNKNLDYTVDELINIYNQFSFYRFNNNIKVKKLWFEVK